jgi:calcineurin-like phosphoesterase family protein
MSSKTWFTSDTHFGHANIIKYCKRPFASVDEMDKRMVENWNARVAPNDVIWHLGDVALSGGKERLSEIMGELNGHKRLILGNHDRKQAAMEAAGFESVWPKGFWLDQLGKGLRHHPPVQELSSNPGLQYLCGHVHEQWTTFFGEERGMAGWICNVGVDVWGFAPVSFGEIIDAVDKARVR